MTHLHPDHAGGLIMPNGSARYEQAELFVSTAELAFWMDRSNRASCSESVHDSFEIVPKIVELYNDRIRPVALGEPVPGIEAMALPGHTPGHTGYMVRDGSDSLLIWGDICHAPEVQCQRPKVTLIFDQEPELAIATRERIFEHVVSEDLVVAGMHMTFPGFSRLAKHDGVYVLQPQAWQYQLTETM
jgi:glyoxylase-like metal-dependent hydrolase (beta-lactamase superfamily II)